jgi:hypothetical protein
MLGSMLLGKSREKLTGQVQAAAERISSNILAVLGIALGALVLAAGSLIVSLRVLKSVRA